jgi:hypothetical protein
MRSPIWGCMGRTRVVPGGSGGGIPGNGGCTSLAFWRFFSGRGLAITLSPLTLCDGNAEFTLCGPDQDGRRP